MQAEVHPVERPAEREGYDCAPGARGVQAARYDLEQVQLDSSRAWFHPPECLVLDASGLGCLSPICLATPVGLFAAQAPRATYNVTSGQYATTLPAGPTLAGNSGVGLKFDCAHCPPPWAL